MLYNNTSAIPVTETSIKIVSEHLGREVFISLFTTEAPTDAPVNLLLLNDGQEAKHLNLPQALNSLYDASNVMPIVIAAIHAGKERIQEYGVAGTPDFKNRGSKAGAYTLFITEELLPQLKNHLTNQIAEVAFCGFSLGGLSALDAVWNNPHLFSGAGIFSGSLWWRSKGLNEGYTGNHRIMHRKVKEAATLPDLKLFFQCGTKDESADRNGNGIIDSIDDTVDLMAELENKGYTRPGKIKYLEVVGGKHDIATWAASMPKFLCWIFNT